MGLFSIISILITLSALFSYINHRYLKMPTTIGLMFMSILLSLGLIISGRLGFQIEDQARVFVQSIDFNKVLLGGLLSFLLFAGSLHVNINDLLEKKWEIGIFATAGTVCSTFIVGIVSYLLLKVLTLNVPLIYCLVFGALISPTDPISVLGILRKANAPKSLETKITGESLFNDGIGVVVFIVLLGIATGEHEVSFSEIAFFFLEEGAGGLIYGFLLGLLAYYFLKSVDNYQVEILVTLAVTTGGYALALAMHTSGPLAIVTAGLLIGNQGRKFAMSDKTREHLDTFWELMDEILNAMLFVLIGLEVLVLTLSGLYILAGFLSILIVLSARFVSIGAPVSLLRLRREFSPHSVKIMTWGGLRGSISVALALSLPAGPEREIILTMTYAVVVFSVLVQGLSIEYFVKKSQGT
ncbi:MAG: sodium:proton antiporter [Deltaproteobacteria bacterium]|nr:sodium:proton antiporter [Deltaproteobacteria bacterium]MBW2051218.1 sodium:proton antiporter [Deltaproteobacteria bacterium]MBW2139859.1 sodium:proton antiporter [Deltaproteobacteria bacterium]MBW2322023.1 sodium:proton antiporter [Deltaproteobacteria bacterium]